MNELKITFEIFTETVGGGGEGGELTVCVTTDKQKRVSVYTPASVLNGT